VKRFSTRKLMSAMVITLLVVSLVGCKTTKTKVEEAPAAAPIVTQPEKKMEQPVVEPVVEPVMEKTVEVPEVKTPVEAPVEMAPVEAKMEYPLGIKPIVKSDADYPVFDLFIVHTGDIQGNVDASENSIGYARLATMLKVARSLTDNILLLDAGDVISGSAIVEQNNGETAGVLLDMLGYDAVAPSTMDFAYGADYLINAKNSTKDYTDLKVLSANILDKDAYLPFQPYQLYDYNGFNVLVVGLTTPVDCVTDYSFVSSAVINNAQYALDIAHQYADYVVVLGNMDGQITSKFICENLNGIDLFIDGSDSCMSSGQVVNGATIVSTNAKFNELGVVDVVVKNGKATGAYPFTITASDVNNPKHSRLASAYGITAVPEDSQVCNYIESQKAKMPAKKTVSVSVEMKMKATPKETEKTMEPEKAMKPEKAMEPIAPQYPLGIMPIVKSDANYPVFDLFVVHTSDTQGRVYGSKDNIGYARLSTMLQVARSLTSNVLVLDAGDTLAGSAIAEYSNGVAPAMLLDMLGYDAIAPASLEFKYSADTLAQAAAYAKQNSSLRVLSANILDDEKFLPFQPYQLYDYNGFVVAVVGLTAPVEDVDGINFTDDLVLQNAQYALDMAHQYADYVIVLGNMDGNKAGISSELICQNLKGIDLFVDGSDSKIDGSKVVNGTTIVNSKENLGSVGVVDVVVKNGMAIGAYPFEITASDVTDPSNSDLASAYGIINIPEDSKVNHMLASFEEQIAPVLNTVIAKTTYTLSTSNIKKQPTSLSRLVCDALTSELGADATILQAGIFGQSIEKGDVTIADVRDAFTNDYTVCVKAVTGQEIYDALEKAYDALPAESDHYVLTDLKVVYNKYAKAGNRILRVKIGSMNIDKDATYKIVTTDMSDLGIKVSENDMILTYVKNAIEMKF